MNSRNSELQAHFLGTYFGLRTGVAILGTALPILLLTGGRVLDREPVRASISAYYYSASMRDPFVGLLIAVGACLCLYKGFSDREDWALNAAALFAAVVALVPTRPAGEPSSLLTIHGASAVLFFLCLAYVAIWRAEDTLSLVRDPRLRRRYRSLYRTVGTGMVVLPILVWLLGLGARERGGVFWLEAVAIWLFALYWVIKGHEMGRTGAEGLTASGKVMSSAEGARRPGRVVQVEPEEIEIRDWATVFEPPHAGGAG